MTAKTSDIAILLAGKSHPHVSVRVGREFRAIEIGKGGIAALDEATRRAIRGAAVMARVDAAFVDALPALEIVSSFGVGYDHVDAAYCASRNVMVTNTPDVLSEEVADTAVGLLINTVRELPRAEKWLRDGRWKKDGAYPLTAATLRGRHAGIFGLGRIGLAIARRLEAMGLAVSYHNRRPVEGVAYHYHASLKDMAAAVDTLISVVPGGAATDRAVNAGVLEALGSDGVFINIGRGSAVDEQALIEALSAGTIRAAGLDVFADEPNVPEALLALPNACLLPHVGSSTQHTRRAMANLVVDNLVSWFDRGTVLTPVPETAGLKQE
ncbi:2-hydroxyacid dehydrogenase [Mesorhizobium sp. Z1-4]|uniref:2-hydroxyacid dehydrogenase n=1 Tax=Mesorhizobium sp. Z1-4 TaxID=2448478 RepID=UPI000FD76759|nr:2-hydroxyacid dehydrogenase [Mesorhizobium sp. Z1-4]